MAYWVSHSLLEAAPSEAQRRLLDGPGCYTTARVNDGRPVWADFHFRRLAEDAAAIDLAPISEDLILEAFGALARAEFGRGCGVVRLMVCSDRKGDSTLVGETRPLGPEKVSWTARKANFPHPGPGPHPGAKLSHQPTLEKARALRTATGVDEILLFDARGRLVEGCRSSLIVVDKFGDLRTPATAIGGVRSIALEVILHDRVEEGNSEPIHFDSNLDSTTLGAARELIAINAVRGACAITRLDGDDVGDGKIGPRCRELAGPLLRTLATHT